MTFHDSAVFPTDLSFGTASGISFPNHIDEMPGGYAYRHAIGDDGGMRCTVRRRVLSDDRLATLLTFVRTRRGSLYGFRFLNPIDYSTAPNCVDPVDVDDESHRHVIGQGTGVAVAFPLSRTYTDAAGYSVARGITKPMRVSEAQAVTQPNYLQSLVAGDTVTVWIDSTLQVEGVDFSVDYATGVVTFASPPSNGTFVKWAGYYFEPARFGAGVDDWLRTSLNDLLERETDDIEIVSDRTSDSVFALDGHLHGSKWHTCDGIATFSLSFADGGVQQFAADAATVDPLPVILPTALVWMLGGPLCTIANRGSTKTLRLLEDDGVTVVGNIGPGVIADLYLALDASGNPADWLLA